MICILENNRYRIGANELIIMLLFFFFACCIKTNWVMLHFMHVCDDICIARLYTIIS